LRGVEPEVAEAVERAARLLAGASPSAELHNRCPGGLSRAAEVFRVLRALRNLHGITGGPDAAAKWVAENKGGTKPESIWELNLGMDANWKARVAEAEHLRQQIEASFVRYFSAFEVLVCPCALMLPFDKEIRYPSRYNPSAPSPSCGGSTADGPAVELDDYIEWMLPCTLISLTGLPAMSVPVGFSSSGLPLGVQLVGKPGGEAGLLAAGALLERAAAAAAPGAAAAAAATPGAMHAPPVDPRRTADGAAHCPGRWDGPRTAAEAARHHGL